MSAKQLLDEALSLPPEERASLAHDLLLSLEAQEEPGAEAAWLAEIEKRALELADGSVSAVDWDQARERIARSLRERRS